MELFEAIRTRRSIGKVKSDPVDRSLIEQILEAGTWAPNHFRTEPWRFFVLTGEGRRPLGRALAEILKEKLEDADGEEGRAKLQKEEERAFRAPVVIAVAVSPSEDPKVVESEEIAAVCAAIQNMLLAAHALGLGAIWRTGEAAYHPKMKELFGLKERERLLGFLYVGYPELSPPERKRTPFQEKTVWIDADVKYA